MFEAANDFFIDKNQDGIYDLVIENGQFKTVYSFDTALQLSVLAERRADPSEVPIPQRRRGWLGNLLLFDDSYEIGSKVWLLYQERTTDAVLTKTNDYVNDALAWLVEDQHLKSYTVNCSWIYNNGARDGIMIEITYVTISNLTESRYVPLWQNTGKRSIIEKERVTAYLLQEAYDYLDPSGDTQTEPASKILLDGDMDGGALMIDFERQ